MITTVGHLREVLAEFPEYYLVQIEAWDEDGTSDVLGVRKERDTVYLSSELPPNDGLVMPEHFSSEAEGQRS